MASVQDVFKNCSPWMRLSICVNIHIKRALINVLHNNINDPQVQPLPTDAADLYAFLQINKKKIKRSSVIKEHQKSILLPANSQSVDSSSLDITLIRFLIQTFCGIQNAKRDWKEPDPTDQTICAYVYRAAGLRNAIFHDDNIEEMNATTFEMKWKQLKEILQGLKYVEDIEPFKSETLDLKKCEHAILEEFVGHLRNYKKEYSNEPTKDDYIQRRFYVDGSKKHIANESDLESLIKNNDRLVIYGEAGMGKSSTARHVKEKWCNNKILNGHYLMYYDSKRISKHITVPSNAAALFFSELGDHLKKKGRTIDDLSIYNCVKTTIDDLIILIDGIDEFPVKELVTENYVDELERKIMNNEKISGTETISAIYFGLLFPYSKVILFGRIGEFESLKKVQVARDAGIFNRKTKDLELLKFDDKNIRDLSCLKICKQQNRQIICTAACEEIYNKIKNIELCNNPTDLNSVIELYKKHQNENIGTINRTKLMISSLFNRLIDHVNQKNLIEPKNFREFGEDKSKFLTCIRILGEMSFHTLLLRKGVTIDVEEEKDIDGIEYFKYENQIKVECEVLEKLDFFYVRKFDYNCVLEPHHTLYIEFLSACYLFSNPDKWDSILELKFDRKLETIKFIAGLHANDYFIKDFVSNVLITSNHSVELFFRWLYDVKHVRYFLPDGGHSFSCWYGLVGNQKLSPSFFLMDSISHEVEIPQTFIPKTIVFYQFDVFDSFEWYNMKSFKHEILTKCSDELNLKSFSKILPSVDFIIRGNMRIRFDLELNLLDQYGKNDLITFRINDLCISTLALYTSFCSCYNINRLIMEGYDSPTIDMILNAISLPITNTFSNIPPIKCKYATIVEIKSFNSQQTKKLFTFVLAGLLDYISLKGTMLTNEQTKILEMVEQNFTKEMIDIELLDIEFNRMFSLPKLGKRHISLDRETFYPQKYFVTDNDVIEFRKHILPGHSNNFCNYKIISFNVPFVRKENFPRKCEQSMFLNLCRVDFSKVSPDVFAKTFSLIPSLACLDRLIPSKFWLTLSQEDCRIHEMRIWDPKLKNLKHFLKIRTNIMQFICNHKYDLKELLNNLVNNPNVQLDKEIKVFVVKCDHNNWDHYEEIILFGGKTIKEYKDNHSPDNSLLDDIRVPFLDGEQHLEQWVCEISPPTKKNNNLLWLWLGLGLALGLGYMLKQRSVR